MPECPFESKRVKCANCEGPYNVDSGVEKLPVELAKLMLGILLLPPKVIGFVIGGMCDKCGGIIGMVKKDE